MNDLDYDAIEVLVSSINDQVVRDLARRARTTGIVS